MRARSAQKPRPTGAQAAAEQAPLGAAAQILLQAEQAHAAGKLAEAGKHLQLLTAMTFEDAKIRARVAQLKTQVSRALAVDFEKQAAYEEKQQRWALAARSWLRVAEGRPKDSLPLQRAALAQMQVPGVDLKQPLELAKRAVELSDGDPEAHRTLARVYVAAGMQANARRELELAQRCVAPAEEDAAKGKPERGLFKRLLGREAPN
jgi:roadblock/LC7 domain-containing protein